MGLLLGSLFCTIYLCVCSYAGTRLSWYHGLLIQFGIRYCDASYFGLSHNCWGCSGSFMFPYKVLKCLFSICEICHRYFNRDFIESINTLGNMDILMMLIFPIHEHSIFFHLFVSSLISFFSVVQFSEYRSFTSLVSFIPRYFIFLVAVVNGIFFLISSSDISLLVYKNAFNFWIFTLYHAVLPNSLLMLSSFLLESMWFSFLIIIYF